MKLVAVYLYARAPVTCISRFTHYRYTYMRASVYGILVCIRVTNNPYLRITLHIDEPSGAIANHLTAAKCRVRIDAVLCDDKQEFKIGIISVSTLQ